MPPYSYNVYPSSRSGQGAFGRVPGTIALPQPAQDLGNQYPNLGQTNAALSRSILAGLEGQLSPGTINALQDANAAWAVGAGMPATTPGSLTTNRFARNLGLTAENLQASAAQRYASVIPTISSTQTVRPETQIGLAEQNALNLAAPDPQASQSYAQELYNRYLGSLGGSGGRMPQGGTRQPLQSPADVGSIVAPSMGTGTYRGGVLTYDQPNQGYQYYGAGENPTIEDDYYDLGYGPMSYGYDQQDPYMDEGGYDLGYGYMGYGDVGDYGAYEGDLGMSDLTNFTGDY